jgi:hypothetical protein
MAVQRRLRMGLLIVGISCFVAGLLPYYSHTIGPPSDAGFGPMDAPSTTTVRLGLPFSPMFRYHREDRFSADTSSPAASEAHITIKTPDTKSPVELKTVKFSARLSVEWRFEILSWSTAIAAAGIILLVVSSLGRGRRPAAEAVETGTAPGV